MKGKNKHLTDEQYRQLKRAEDLLGEATGILMALREEFSEATGVPGDLVEALSEAADDAYEAHVATCNLFPEDEG